MQYFVTGCAGFIGSNLVDRLLADGHSVIGHDNFSTGQDKFIAPALQSPNFTLVRGDALNLTTLTEAMRGTDFVFHLAANADVRFGTEHPHKDLEQNTIATYNVLEAMRANGIKRIAFPPLVLFTVKHRSSPLPKMHLFLYKHLFTAHPSWQPRV